MHNQPQTLVPQLSAASSAAQPLDTPPVDRGPLRATAMVHVEDPDLGKAIRVLGNAFVEMVDTVPRFGIRSESHLLAQLRAIADDLRHLEGYLAFDVAQGGDDAVLSLQAQRRLHRGLLRWKRQLGRLAGEIEEVIRQH